MEHRRVRQLVWRPSCAGCLKLIAADMRNTALSNPRALLAAKWLKYPDIFRYSLLFICLLNGVLSTVVVKEECMTNDRLTELVMILQEVEATQFERL